MLRMLPLGDAITEKAWLRLGVTLAICLGLVVLPLVFGFDHRLINGVLFVAIFAILALGLNIVVGNTGLLELGFVTFLATGAVVTFNLLLWKNATGDHPFAESSFAYLCVILASGLVCAVLGLLRGIPTLKLTGDYYAIVTLGLAEIAYLIFLNSEFTGGAFGMKLSFSSRPTLLGDHVYYDSWQFYYLVLGSLGLTLLVMDRLNRSRIGRAWAAIRLDVVAARASGINISKNKMIAFTISGFFGGVGGSLYAVWIGTVATKSLDVWQSILILCAVVLGGMGSLRGVLLGSLILFPLREVLREQLDATTAYLVLGLVIATAAMVCWVRILVRMFKDTERAGSASCAVGFVFQPWAYVWGWRHRSHYPGQLKVMVIWSVCIILIVLLSGLLGFVGADASVRVPPEASNLVYGLLLILVMRFRPEGLLPRGAGGLRREMTKTEIAAVHASRPALFVLDLNKIVPVGPREAQEDPPAAIVDSKEETVIDEGEDDGPEPPTEGDAEGRQPAEGDDAE